MQDIPTIQLPKRIQDKKEDPRKQNNMKLVYFFRKLILQILTLVDIFNKLIFWENNGIF